MAVLKAFDASKLPLLPFLLGVLAFLTTAFLYAFRRPSFTSRSPKLVSDTWPILGSLRFFTARWDFFRSARAHSPSGNFAFYAGAYPIVGLTGDEGRRVFFESRQLSLSAGYAALLGGTPQVQQKPVTEGEADTTFDGYFAKRLLYMLKPQLLAKALPTMFADIRGAFEALQSDPKGFTDPFYSIYRLVYLLTMRTVAANEIANNPVELAKSLTLYEEIERTATPASIMYPWLPTPAKFKKMYAGGKLYMMFKSIMDDRTKNGRREEDPLQYLMDLGDDVTRIITVSLLPPLSPSYCCIIDNAQFVLGALFAGLLNSGINAAWILVYLAANPHWLSEVRKEVAAVADRYNDDKDAPLVDRLASIPLEAWESEFPLIDLCLRDSIRLQLHGTAFRRNTSGQTIKLSTGEEIPDGAYATYATADVHYDPEIYPNPDEWNPGRYMPGRAEDQKKKYAYIGWGVSRHPCLGMKFAKLENNLMTAFFVAMFDFGLCDGSGKDVARPPKVNLNRHSAYRPDENIYLKYRTREKAV